MGGRRSSEQPSIYQLEDVDGKTNTVVTDSGVTGFLAPGASNHNGHPEH